MEHYWAVAAVVFAIMYLLLEAFLCSSLVVYILQTVAALFLTWLIMNGIKRSLLRKNIEVTADKAVFVTGCDSGFGYDISIELHTMGFHVFSGCLSANSKGAQELKRIDSPLLTVLQVDVTQDKDVQEALKTIKESLIERKLWAIVNNAGISGVFAEIEWIPLEIYQKVLEVNTIGAVRVTKAFLPLLRKSQGRVVIVSSLAGRYVFPGAAPYSVSKHAVLCYADVLRREMKKWNVSVHTVEPAFYRTPLMEKLKEDTKATWQRVPKSIRDSYGEEYYKQFEAFIDKANDSAKPASKLYEVTNDVVDAIAGVEPFIRYVPSFSAYIRSLIICALPTKVQDYALCKLVAPKIPPSQAAQQ